MANGLLNTAREMFVRRFSSRCSNSFGIVLDIDGVLQRGREILPRVHDAFRLLTDSNNQFTIPTVFLTNGTNCLRSEKASKLTQHLGIPIHAKQVLMAHSALRMCHELHEKNVLVVGQEHAKTIATAVGFKNVTTMSELRIWFPELDCNDFSRIPVDVQKTLQLRKQFKPIDAIVLLGEPVIWESAFQLILDVLLTEGTMIDSKRRSFSHQIPVVACNADWVWMAEGSHRPRLGHGAFLHCLESMFQQLTGTRLHYEMFFGKPAEISYMHAAHVIQRQAHEIGLNAVKTLYVIGDNPMSDVLGAKLFNRYLKHGGKGRFDQVNLDLFEETDPPEERSRHVVDRCVSILVETGVYKEGCRMNATVQPVSVLLEHLSPGEQAALQQPDFVERDLYAAVRQILNRERQVPSSPGVFESVPLARRF